MVGSRVGGSIGMTVSSGDYTAGFSGDIRDFDKATKTSELATLINRKNTYMSAWTHNFVEDDGSERSLVRLQDCSLRIAAKDEDDDGVADSAKWKLDCDSDALTRIGLSQGAQNRLLEIFENVDPEGADAKALSFSSKGIRE
jgi:hypothetical protein